jgi:hypothetical protein
MTHSYQLLYEIETTLRKVISNRMKIAYGATWEYSINEKHPFSSCYFHELIPYFAKYKPLHKIYTIEERNQLYQLTSIRNKICHMKMLDQQEYTHLKKCHLLVVRIFEIKIYRKEKVKT